MVSKPLLNKVPFSYFPSQKPQKCAITHACIAAGGSTGPTRPRKSHLPSRIFKEELVTGWKDAIWGLDTISTKNYQHENTHGEKQTRTQCGRKNARSFRKMLLGITIRFGASARG